MINGEFNKQLLEEIRLFYGNLIIKGNSIDIVPEEFTHRYLLSNFKIPKVIEEYYYLPCRDMLSNEDYDKFVSTGYIGNPNTTLSPYPFCFNGAYFQRKKLFYQILHLKHTTEKYKGKTIEKFSDLFPYFEDYSLGFKSGFDGFEEDCIKKFLPMFAEKSDYINKVFEYITKEIIFRHSWRNNHSGFTVSMINNGKLINGGEIKDAYEDGKFQGYFFKAWSLIFSNSNLFEELFNNFLNPKEILNKNNIINDLLQAVYTMQQNKIFWTSDEDARTRQILDLLPEKYQTKDQSKYGKSQVGKKPGSVDGVIKLDNNEFFIEAFNLNSLNKTIIKSHIKKLEKNYDSKGLKEKFIIAYYNLKPNTFNQAVEKYKNYIENEHIFIYPKIGMIKETLVNYTDSRLFQTHHNREGKDVILYHILLKFPK